MTARTRLRIGLLATAVLAFGLPAIATTAAVAATTTPVTAISPAALPLAQPVPGHTGLVPDVPRTNMPKIANGEIWDIAVIPQLNRVFIAGSFTSIQNQLPGNTTTYQQRYLASYNYQTGAGRHRTSGQPSTAASLPSRPRPTAPSCSSAAPSTPSTTSPCRKSRAST